VVIKTAKDVVNLARIFLGAKLDELGRDAVVSHITSLNANLFTQGLTFSRLEKSMIEYVSTNGIGLNEVKPIDLSWTTEERDEELEFLRSIVSYENARKVLSGFDTPHPKLLIIFPRDHWNRIKLSYGISRLLLLHGLTSFIVFSDRPLDQIPYIFDNLVIITDKMLPMRDVTGWTIVNLKRVEGEHKPSNIDTTLEKAGYTTKNL
jgi:hypothetical protein